MTTTPLGPVVPAAEDPEVTTLDPHPELDALAKGAPHCKTESHVQVVVLGDHPTSIVTATHVDHMTCAQPSLDGSPGVILSHRHSAPLDGLHMMPSLVAVMPGWLRVAAQHALGMAGVRTVAIQHFDKPAWVLFAAVTPQAALDLATAIERVA